jgi:hypothetical protein
MTDNLNQDNFNNFKYHTCLYCSKCKGKYNEKGIEKCPKDNTKLKIIFSPGFPDPRDKTE